jgi:branched-chain amino acid transport system ATP-binding protein
VAGLLEVREIETFYGELQALFGVSLQVERGESVAIIGANGAGKSTLLRTILGVQKPRRGEVRFQGQAVTGSRTHRLARAGLALVPEGRRIFPSLSVRENLLLAQGAGRKGPWTLERVLKLFPALAERINNGGTDLSGGQQQMLAIGRALLLNPELLMLDELSLGLAPVVVKELYAALEDVRREGCTLVIVEQDVTRALAASDRVYCLLEGTVSFQGASKGLSAHDLTGAYFGTVGQGQPNNPELGHAQSGVG